jgi:hypothetical protein
MDWYEQKAKPALTNKQRGMAIDLNLFLKVFHLTASCRATEKELSLTGLFVILR